MEDFLFRNIFKPRRLIFKVCIDLHHLTIQVDVIRNKEHIHRKLYAYILVTAVVKGITWQIEFKELNVRRAAVKDEKTRQTLHV